MENKCKKCGCTDNDCSQCIEKTGEPCYWVYQDLCSVCWEEGLDESIIIHEIKINQEYAEAYYAGLKPWELRKNDRNYQVGDLIKFEIKKADGGTVGFYERKIKYVFKGGQYGLAEDYCILTLECNDCINYDLKN